MIRSTWEHECAEERGIVPGYPFRSLQFLSEGLPGEKVPRYAISTTELISACLYLELLSLKLSSILLIWHSIHIQCSPINLLRYVVVPHQNSLQTYAQTEIGVMQQTHIEMDDLEAYYTNKSIVKQWKAY